MIHFEEQTAPLTEWEKNTLLPLMVKGLKTKLGKDNAVTSKQIIASLSQPLYDMGGKLSGARIRKVINHIRLNGLVRNLVASSKGYYIENNSELRESYKQSLRDRISAIRAVLESFDK